MNETCAVLRKFHKYYSHDCNLVLFIYKHCENPEIPEVLAH